MLGNAIFKAFLVNTHHCPQCENNFEIHHLNTLFLLSRKGGILVVRYPYLDESEQNIPKFRTFLYLFYRVYKAMV